MKSDFKKYLLPIGILVVILLVSVLYLANPTPVGKPSSVSEIDMVLHVAENSSEVGFDTGIEKLKFGWVPASSYSKKNITVTNDGTDAQVVIKAEGELADWIEFSDSSFNLANGESKDIQLKAIVPKDAQPGDVTGTLKIYFYR